MSSIRAQRVPMKKTRRDGFLEKAQWPTTPGF